MHLIALRGAEITPARKSKGASALDLPGWGWAAGELEELPVKRILERAGASCCAHLERPPLSSLLFSSLPPFPGGPEEAPRKK